MSETGRVFSMVIIVTGVGAFAYTFATLGEQLISGQLVSNLRQRGTEAMMRRFTGASYRRPVMAIRGRLLQRS